jgi:hypothetical protein
MFVSATCIFFCVSEPCGAFESWIFGDGWEQSEATDQGKGDWWRFADCPVLGGEVGKDSTFVKAPRVNQQKKEDCLSVGHDHFTMVGIFFVIKHTCFSYRPSFCCWV